MRIAAQELISDIIEKIEIGGELDSFFEKSLLGLKYAEMVGNDDLRDIECQIMAENFRKYFFTCLKNASPQEFDVLQKFAYSGYLEGKITKEVEIDSQNKESPVNQTKIYSTLNKSDEKSSRNILTVGKNGNKATLKNLAHLYPVLNLLPFSLIFILIKKGPMEFSNLFFDEDYVSPYLIWNSGMRDELYRILEGRLERYKHSLSENLRQYRLSINSRKQGHMVQTSHIKDIYDVFPKIKVKS